MKKQTLELFKYNDWANQLILIKLEENQINDQAILGLYSHLLSAQIIWLNRVKDIPTSPFPIHERYNLRELNSMTEESSRNWLSFIDEHPNQTFEEMINYKNSIGKSFELTLRQIMTHVVNHSTHHRAQIVMKLREMNIEPPITDYIAYARLQ